VIIVAHKIELIALYPNSTQILQSMDVSIFRPVKMAWKNTVNEYRVKNKYEALRKEDFGSLIKKAIDSIDISKCLRNFEFVDYVLNADTIDYSKVTHNQNRRRCHLKKLRKINVKLS